MITIAAPQVEQGIAATRVILTGPARVTRAADLPKVRHPAGTYDVPTALSTGVVDTFGVVHAGCDVWPPAAKGLVHPVHIFKLGAVL